jgi:hypothetical protein
MIVLVLFVMTMFLGALGLVPPPYAALAPVRPFLAFIAVLLLGVTTYWGRFSAHPTPRNPASDPRR